jgi:hypothetical protein
MMTNNQSLMSGLLIDYVDGGGNDTLTLENVEDTVVSPAYKNATGYDWGVQVEKCFTYSTTPRIFSNLRLSALGMYSTVNPNAGFNEIRILGGKASTLTRPDYVCTNPTGTSSYAGHTKFFNNWQLQGTDICASAGQMYKKMSEGSVDVTCGRWGQGVLSAVTRILAYEKAVRDGENTCTIPWENVFQWTREGLEMAQRVEDNYVDSTFSNSSFALMVGNLHYIYYTHIDYINDECKQYQETNYSTAMWSSFNDRDIEVSYNPSEAYSAWNYWVELSTNL